MGTRITGATASDAPPPALQDLQLFREAGGWDVVSAVAEFWCSRVEWSPGEEKFHLKGESVAMVGGVWMTGKGQGEWMVTSGEAGGCFSVQHVVTST